MSKLSMIRAAQVGNDDRTVFCSQCSSTDAIAWLDREPTGDWLTLPFGWQESRDGAYRKSLRANAKPGRLNSVRAIVAEIEKAIAAAEKRGVEEKRLGALRFRLLQIEQENHKSLGLFFLIPENGVLEKIIGCADCGALNTLKATSEAKTS